MTGLTVAVHVCGDAEELPAVALLEVADGLDVPDGPVDETGLRLALAVALGDRVEEAPGEAAGDGDGSAASATAAQTRTAMPAPMSANLFMVVLLGSGSGLVLRRPHHRRSTSPSLRRRVNVM